MEADKCVTMNLLIWLNCKLLKIKKEYNSLNARELSESIILWCAIPLDMVGVRVLSDCEMKFYSGATGLMIGLDSVLCFYTTYYYWNINKVSAIQSYTVLSLAIPVFSFSN